MRGVRVVGALVLGVAAALMVDTVRAHPVRANEVAAGSAHSCALTGNGKVLCWGVNGAGQLGDGTTMPRRSPVPVAGLSGLSVTAVAAGANHTCALIADGSVRCWGYNNYGQLGDGSTASRSSPVAVVGLAGLTVTALAVGESHSCAVISDGSLRCWGWNAWGQLGDGGTASQNFPVLVALPGLTVTAVAAGYGHSCALLNNGGLRCWGMNHAGQLGDGSNSHSLAPVVVSGLSGLTATSLATRASHTCAAFSDGSARCWGRNDTGQLGDGSTSNRNAPVVVAGLSGMAALALSVGELHSCARLSGGALRCWGDNWYGQLGDGTTMRRLTAVASIDQVGQIVTSMSAGKQHVCARLGDATLRCWGDNGLGQVGDGTVAQRERPVVVGALSGLGVTSVAAGFWHSCATFANAGPHCWGNNRDAQLGDGSTTHRVLPTPVNGLAGVNVTAVAGSESHTCALVADGSVRCWGQNNRGQLGDGSTTNRTTPVMVTGLAGLVATAVAVGSGHSCARISDGTLRCWGQNLYGQVGDGTTTDRSTPVQVEGLAGLNVTAVAAGGSHTCARTSDGVMRCWGGNSSGQLGDGTNSDRSTPVVVSGLSGLQVVAPVAGYVHSCARLSDGSLRCWGDNSYGQLGDGTTSERNAPVAVLGLSGQIVVEAGGGEGHSCARLADGSLRCWGDNNDGQLGDGTTLDRHTPVVVIGLAGIDAIGLAVGGLHNCARISDGTLRCWGENRDGRLGNGESSAYPMPRVVIDRLFADAFETP